MAQKVQKHKTAKTSKVADANTGNSMTGMAVYGFLLLVLVGIAFSGALSNHFLRWDDHLYVTENKFVLKPTFEHFRELFRQVIAANYHPLTMWSMWFNARLFGAGPQSFIAVNILLHALNSVLAFYWLWLLTGRKTMPAFFAALLFALHPMRVESVVWVSERKDVLYMFFLLAGLIAYWFYAENGARRYWWWALGLMFLSVLSKGVAVIFPLLCLLTDYWKGRHFDKKLILEKAPMFAISLLFGLLAVAAQSGKTFGGFLEAPYKQETALSVHYSVFQNICFAGYSLMMYAVKTVWPFGLSPIYPYPVVGRESNPVYWLGLLFGLGLLGWTVWAVWKDRRKTAFFLLFFWVSIILVLRFYSIGAVMMADRYMYLPSIAVWGGLVWGLWGRGANAFNMALGTACVLGLFFLVRTRTQARIWADDETFWHAVLDQYPENDQAMDALGNYLGRKGRIDEAIAQLEKAVSDGCLMPDAYGGLASAYSFKAQQAADNPALRDQYRQKARQLYEQAFKLDPDNGPRYYDRALSRYEYDPEGALQDLESATRYEPGKKAVHDLLRGLSLINLQRNAEAAASLSASITALEAAAPEMREPNHAQQVYLAYLNRGVARFNSGDRNGGISDVQHAVALAPGDPEAQRILEGFRQQNR